MKLLTKELKEAFTKQGDTSSKDAQDIKVIAKFFNPCGGRNADSGCTWFAVEYLPDERLFFGYANLGDNDCAELGYFSLAELESVRLPFGMGIERDLYWDNNTSLQEVINCKGQM